MRPGATIGIVFGLLWVGGPVETVAQGPEELITLTSDGVTLHGERYFGDLDAAAPLILLFHQGASSGRGEYSPLIPWLNGAGFRAIAWDQRAGGDRHGEDNRTAAGLEEGVPSGYCDAYPDLQAALDFVIEAGLARQVVIWGSSYSGALVFRLAAENRDRVSGVVAFSPAAGGPMVDCQGRRWLDEVTAPMLVYRPRSEMEIESSQEQRDIFTAAGASFIVVENGVHGSSMLIDARTGQDMSATRGALIEWLKREGAAAPGTAQPPASGLRPPDGGGTRRHIPDGRHRRGR